jgi:hypothetical protein
MEDVQTSALLAFSLNLEVEIVSNVMTDVDLVMEQLTDVLHVLQDLPATELVFQLALLIQ